MTDLTKLTNEELLDELALGLMEGVPDLIIPARAEVERRLTAHDRLSKLAGLVVKPCDCWEVNSVHKGQPMATCPDCHGTGYGDGVLVEALARYVEDCDGCLKEIYPGEEKKFCIPENCERLRDRAILAQAKAAMEGG